MGPNSSSVIVPALGSICMLCQIKPPIKNSHLWPQFAVDWIKQNSSPYLRRGDAPNQRRQDVTTFPLLCLDCENIFSKFEHKFCELVFKPFQKDRNTPYFHYEDWLSQFVISLSWRMLAIEFERFVREHPEQALAATNAFEYWRKFLRGSILEIEPYRHHMFFFSLTEINQSAIHDLPDKFHSYILRSFDGCIAPFDSKGIVYVLLPGIAFWSPLHIRDDEGWGKNSAIKIKGKFKLAQKVQDERFGALLHESAGLAFNSVLSEKQQRLVAAEYQKALQTKSPEELAKITESSSHDALLRQIRQSNLVVD